MLRKVVFTALLSFVTLSGYAAVMPPPTSLCSAPDCAISNTPMFSKDNVSIYSGLDLSYSPLSSTPTIWAGYTLGSQSKYYDPGTGYPDGTTHSQVTEPLTGTVWIKAQSTYGGSGDMGVSLYLPSGNTGSYNQFDFTFDPGALVSGHGTSYSSGGYGEVSNVVTNGNIQPTSGLESVLCVECGWNLELNLVDFNYLFDGSGNYSAVVSSGDNRNLIFSLQSTYYYDTQYTYTLSAVPLPASGWLFISGMSGLMIASRRVSRVGKHIINKAMPTPGFFIRKVH